MSRIDFNCFIGGWPFHKVRKKTIGDLLALHDKNGITGAYVSSTDAIFFNDPYEAELELAAALKGTGYRQVMTVNPTLPGCFADIRRGLTELGIAGVRIMPGFHDYTLDSAPVSELCGLLRELKLPLWLTPRMEDERVTYMFHPKSVPLDAMKSFLAAQTGFPVLLANARLHEILALKEIIEARGDVFADACGLKDGLFPVERLYEAGIAPAYLVYGSLQPIFCLKSSLLLVEKADIPNEACESILSGVNFLLKLKP